MNPPTNLQFLWSSLFSGAFCSVNVKWYTFLFVRQENKTGKCKQVTLRSVLVNNVAVEKQWVLHIVCVCVSVLSSMPNTSFLHRITFSSVSCLAIPYISTSSHKGTIFGGGKKGLLNIKYKFWFSLQMLSKIFLILSRIQQGHHHHHNHRHHRHHHHHHHLPEGLGMLACSLILKMKLVPPSLPRSSYNSARYYHKCTYVVM